MSLTDSDKQWISEQLGGIERRFDEKLSALELRFDEKLEALETRFDEKLERVETRLLTEFHRWASPNELRQRSHTDAIRALELEVQDVKDA